MIACGHGMPTPAFCAKCAVGAPPTWARERPAFEVEEPGLCLVCGEEYPRGTVVQRWKRGTGLEAQLRYAAEACGAP